MTMHVDCGGDIDDHNEDGDNDTNGGDEGGDRDKDEMMVKVKRSKREGGRGRGRGRSMVEYFVWIPKLPDCLILLIIPPEALASVTQLPTNLLIFTDKLIFYPTK